MARLVRIATAGSVDDGKSTLIGRLLYDTKTIFEDQLGAVERTSRQRGSDHIDLALLTDSLRAEREQGITIDVAYRYFATPQRKFIIADTPGHVQYTRNMVTGASTADIALIIVDARNGLLEQTRRHAFLAALLGIRHLVVCVNKMDLVGWSMERFDQIREDFRRFAMKLRVDDITFIPISALHGENVVQASTSMPWYEGTSLLHHLEELHVSSDRNLIDVRLPVQFVIRRHDFRGYAGCITAGVLRVGDDVVVLPSGFTSTVRTMWGPGGAPLSEVFPPQSIVVELADELDVGRGDLLCRPGNRPHSSQRVDALICWLTEHAQLTTNSAYSVLHNTRSTRGRIRRLSYRLDINSLHRDESAGSLSLNEIGRISLDTSHPIHFDPYTRNRATGSFILIDESTNNTVAAGMIIGPSVDIPEAKSSNVVWHFGTVDHAERGAHGVTVWLTGFSASGKSSIAVELERQLIAAGRPAYLLDGDNLRHGLNADLGFGAKDRVENVRRVGEVATLFADAGLVAVVSLISPYRADRDRVREAHAKAGLPFFEIFVDTPLEVCEARDPKGLYARARAGAISGFTGIDDPYEHPYSPDLVLRPEDGDPVAMAAEIMGLLGT